jgi:hypothetical protein
MTCTQLTVTVLGVVPWCVTLFHCWRVAHRTWHKTKKMADKKHSVFCRKKTSLLLLGKLFFQQARNSFITQQSRPNGISHSTET